MRKFKSWFQKNFFYNTPIRVVYCVNILYLCGIGQPMTYFSEKVFRYP